jgi:hypothetical protein
MALKLSGSDYLFAIKRAFFILIVKALTFIFPESKWYKSAILLSNFFGLFKVLRSKIKSKGLFKAQDLNSFLSLMTRRQRTFPIPYKISGLESFDEDCGIILCSVHIPSVKVTLRGLIDNHVEISAAIVGTPPASNTMSLWGITDKVPIIVKNTYSLIKAKTVLENKGSLVLMVDHTETGLYSPNIMKLCGKLDAKVVFFFAELNAQNVVESYLIEAPFPRCRTAEEINQNLIFLRKKHDEILENYRKATI